MTSAMSTSTQDTSREMMRRDPATLASPPGSDRYHPYRNIDERRQNEPVYDPIVVRKPAVKSSQFPESIFVGLMENKSLNCLSIGRQTVEQTSDESDEAAVEEIQNALADTMAAVFQTNSTLLKLSLAIFPPYPSKKFAEFNYELKIKDKNTKEHIERAHKVNCMHYDLKFFAGQKSSSCAATCRGYSFIGSAKLPSES